MASEPTWEAVKFQNFLGEDAPRPPYAFNFRTNIVCPCCALATAMSWLRHWKSYMSLRKVNAVLSGECNLSLPLATHYYTH